MLSLSQRDCQLGEKYSGRKKRDEDTWTLKLELTGLVLERNEVNAILRPSRMRLRRSTTQAPIRSRPFIGCIKAIELQNAWDGAHVVLWYELGKRKIEFKQAKLTKLKVHPTLGGETRFSCIVEGAPPLDKQLAEIIERAGKSIEVEIHAERPEDQQDLPLSQHGEGEHPEGARRKRPWAKRGSGKRRNGSRPAAH